MSAFVVEDKTINTVIAMLKRSEYLFNTGWFLRKLKEAGFDLEDGGDERLGKAMFELNCRAVDERYRPGACAEFRSLDYRFERTGTPERMKGLKALDCWLYQCSEETVPETSLFKLMDGIADSIRKVIVQRMPEYEAACWG